MTQVICFDNYDQANIEFSNWYRADFTVDGRQFSSVEQYMMYEKAMLFGDKETAEKVLEVHDAAEIKALGRQVKNYDDGKWNGIRQIVVYNGALAKFSQNPELSAKLASTGDSLLAECEPSDKIWGIGMSLDDDRRRVPEQWQGQNLLGYTLMMVRKQI